MSAPRPHRIDDLIRVLGDLARLHTELLAVVQEKVTAMKRAEIDRMRDLGLAEQQLAARIEQREGLRRQLADKVAEQLGLGARGGRKLTASALAERLPTPHQDKFRAAANALREAVTQVSRVNHTASRIAQGVLTHYRAIFSALATPAGPAARYGVHGRTESPRSARIFETIG